jgi:hypothetical protein
MKGRDRVKISVTAISYLIRTTKNEDNRTSQKIWDVNFISKYKIGLSSTIHDFIPPDSQAPYSRSRPTVSCSVSGIRSE